MRILAVLAILCSAVFAAEPPESTPASMDELLQLYLDFGLPLPPTDAPLVKAPTGWSTQLDSGKHLPIYTLGFLLKARHNDTPAEVLIGPLRINKELSPGDGEPVQVKPEDVAVDTLSFDNHISTFPLDTALATAIQCHARGYTKLAKALLAKAPTLEWQGNPVAVRSGNGPWMQHRDPADYRGQPGHDARARLAGTAWTYWMNETIRPESDWKIVATTMKKILAASPALNDERRKAYLHSLEAALAPSAATPGSIEGDIDALVNCTRSAGTLGGDHKPDDRYQKLLLRGFEAVPALIDHLDDARLSRSIMEGFNNFPAMPRHVGELVADLLQDIAGEDFSRDWLQRQLGGSVQKESVTQWWKKAQAMGEEKYMREHVIPRDRKTESLHEPHLAIIRTRYPQYLPGLYEEILKQRPSVQTHSLAEAIGKSALPREQKLALIELGAMHSTLMHRLPAIRALRSIDPNAADAATLKFIEQLPKQVHGSVWTSDESSVAHLVMESPTPRVWEAFLVAAKRADVSLRMELMNPMDYTYVGDRQRQQRLHFLAQFLDDETVRDLKSNPKLYDGPCAGFTIHRLSVRDFAAMNIANLLNFRDDPNNEWTPKQWAALRKKVSMALKNEAGK